MKEFNALKIAHYDFTNDKGKKVNTSKLIVNLEQYGTREINTELANDCDVFAEVKVTLEYKDDKIKIKDVIK